MQKVVRTSGWKSTTPPQTHTPLTWSLQKQDPITLQRIKFIFQTTRFIVHSVEWWLGVGRLGLLEQGRPGLPRMTLSDSRRTASGVSTGQNLQPTLEGPLLLLLSSAPALLASLPPSSIFSSALPGRHGSLQLTWAPPTVWHITHKHLRIDRT